MKNIGATLGHIRDTRTMRRQEKHLVSGKKEILIILVQLITIQKNHTKFHLISGEFNPKNGMLATKLVNEHLPLPIDSGLGEETSWQKEISLIFPVLLLLLYHQINFALLFDFE
jgi:hypothetical protein